MPVKLGSKLAPESAEARIEIIPLIDIMFFLLAAFMLVSLSMVSLKVMKMNLPTATTSTSETQKDFAALSVDKNGGVFLDQKPMADHELGAALTEMKKKNANLRVLVSGDNDAKHGALIHVLDIARRAGIDKVAFEIRSGKEVTK